MDRFWIDSARCELPANIRILLERFPKALRAAFLNTLEAYFLAACDSEELTGTDDSAELLADLANDLFYLVTMPLDPRIWGFEFEPTEEQFCEGCAMMLEALSLFIPKPGTGQPLEHHPGSLIPRLRDRDDPEFGRTVVVLEEEPDAPA